MFYFDDFYGKKVLKSTLLNGVDAFFTTRDFVLTPADRSELAEISDVNRLLLKDKLSSGQLITAKQIHSDNIQIANKNDFFYDNTDAVISNIEGSVILLNFADCVPIILYSPEYNVGSVVHAGWRGTSLQILKKTVNLLSNKFAVNPSKITALIGPSIDKCCFQTDEDVFNKLISDKSDEDLYTKKDNKYYIDLKLINKKQLEEAGVENIDICTYCTCCMSDIFFSYRKEKGKTARHSAIIKIREDKLCQ